MRLRILTIVTALFFVPAVPAIADSGVITSPSSYSAAETMARFETAIKKRGFMVFAHLDHSAAAKQKGLSMPFSTVVVFGNPKVGTPGFIKVPESAIDLPLKALVWENQAGKAFLSYNSGTYVLQTLYPRHGRKVPQKVVDTVNGRLAEIAAETTK